MGEAASRGEGGGKERDHLLDRLGLQERTIVSFDLRRLDHKCRWAIHRALHGRVERRRVNGGEKVYRYPGILHEGGIRLGQSVYMLPPELASRLIVVLRDLHVRFTWREVYSPGIG